MLPLTKKHRKLWGLVWLHSTILRRSLHHDVCLRALSYFILFIFINQAASFIMDSLYCPSVSKALDKDCGVWWWVWFKHGWSWDFDVLSHWSSDQDRALCGRSARLQLDIKHQILFHTERADHFVSLAHVSKMFLFCPILSGFMGSYSAALTVFCCISYLLNSSLLFLSCCKWLCYSSCRLRLL